MHELSICEGILDVATAALREIARPVPRVTGITVKDRPPQLGRAGHAAPLLRDPDAQAPSSTAPR